MRVTLVTIMILLSSCVSSSMYVTPFVAVPHNEPIFEHSPYQALYGGKVDLNLEYKGFFYNGDFRYYGLQKWKYNTGHGFNAWKERDWHADVWRWDWTHEFGYNVTDRVAWWNEYYQPQPNVNEDICCYHWLTGVRVKLW